MNVNDTELVRRILVDQAGYVEVENEDDAEIILTNTCAIREGAETKIWTRLSQLRAAGGGNRKRRQQKSERPVLGVLGCMAERLPNELLDVADVVVGPDAYRDLPKLLEERLQTEERQVNVDLSTTETYADITPLRTMSSCAAYVSIQRGCSNRCSFCIVPFTRGIERSRPLTSVVDEVRRLVEEEQVREVTLLGQNVNSYHDQSVERVSQYQLSNSGFVSRTRRSNRGYFFADLLEAVADIAPGHLRVRFTSPHPKDYPSHLLQLMAERPNICEHLHMPAQSGSTSVLSRMKRGYTRDAYLQLLQDTREVLPDVSISSDFIAGFCGETDAEHAETVSLMETVQFDLAFMFAYSMREQTHAAKRMVDDVPATIKQQRLQEIIDTFQSTVHAKNHEHEVGRLRLVLVEGESKRSQPGNRQWNGRTDQNKRILFPIGENRGVICFREKDILNGLTEAPESGETTLNVGDYAVVLVTEAKGHTLRGRLLWVAESISSFHSSGLSGADTLSKQRADSVSKLLCQALHECSSRFLSSGATSVTRAALEPWRNQTGTQRHEVAFPMNPLR